MSSSPSGISLGPNQNSGSDEDFQQIMDIRKRKRMISNRESARRSRMRKQEHLAELKSQAEQLAEQNKEIVKELNRITQNFLGVETENNVLRAQYNELNCRLNSLNDIINFLNISSDNNDVITPFLDQTEEEDAFHQMMFNTTTSSFWDDDFLNPWKLLNVNQSIMASSDVFMY